MRLVVFLFLAATVSAHAMGSIHNYVNTTTAAYANVNSLGMNGTDEYCDAGAVAVTTNFSAFIWVKPSAATAGLAAISKWEASDSERSFVIQSQDTDATHFQILLSGNGTTIHKNYRSSVVCLSTAAWHHIGFTFAGGTDTLTMYCDASADGSPSKVSDTSLGGAIFTSAAKLMLGVISKNGGGVNSAFWVGKVDSPTIWDKVLSGGEITSLYNSGHPGDAEAHSAVANLKNWWPLGEFTDNTTTLIDRPGTNDCTGVNLDSADIQTDIP